MIPRRVFTSLLTGWVLLATAPLWAATQLRQVAITASQADGARLVLELSAAPSAPRVFALENPARLVIDLPRTSQASGLKMPAPVGPVRELRDGRQSNGTLRLVLGLRQELAFKSRIEGRQLIIELGRAPIAAAAVAVATAAPRPVRAPHAPEDAGRDVIVAIDAGHGGQDPGASGHGGTREKDVALAIARALAKRIDAEPGMRAYLTRNEDRFIELRQRIVLARRARADIFVSIHADSIGKTDVSGSSVYVLSSNGASKEAARWLAEQENAADLKGGISLDDKDDALASLLLDVSQTKTIGDSGAAAERVLAQLDRVGTVRKTKVEPAPFLVLKSPDIPSMLVETGYISNPGEEKKLKSASHQQALAEAIFNGVRDYFRQSPPDGTLFKRQRDEQRLLAAGTAP